MLEMTGEQHPLPVTGLWAEQVDGWRSFPPEPHPVVKSMQAAVQLPLTTTRGQVGPLVIS